MHTEWRCLCMTVPLFFLLCSDGENRVWSSLYIAELFRQPEGVDLASQASYMAHTTLKIIRLRIKQRHLFRLINISSWHWGVWTTYLDFKLDCKLSRLRPSTLLTQCIALTATRHMQNRKSMINACLNNTTATFIKILLVKITDWLIRQNFALSNFCTIEYYRLNSCECPWGQTQTHTIHMMSWTRSRLVYLNS